MFGGALSVIEPSASRLGPQNAADDEDRTFVRNVGGFPRFASTENPPAPLWCLGCSDLHNRKKFTTNRSPDSVHCPFRSSYFCCLAAAQFLLHC